MKRWIGFPKVNGPGIDEIGGVLKKNGGPLAIRAESGPAEWELVLV